MSIILYFRRVFWGLVVVLCNGGLRPQCHILTLQRMFKSTSSGYRVDKWGPSNCWISVDNYRIDYPCHFQGISLIKKKIVTAMVEKKNSPPAHLFGINKAKVLPYRAVSVCKESEPEWLIILNRQQKRYTQ